MANDGQSAAAYTEAAGKYRQMGNRVRNLPPTMSDAVTRGANAASNTVAVARATGLLNGRPNVNVGRPAATSISRSINAGVTGPSVEPAPGGQPPGSRVPYSLSIGNVGASAKAGASDIWDTTWKDEWDPYGYGARIPQGGPSPSNGPVMPWRRIFDTSTDGTPVEDGTYDNHAITLPDEMGNEGAGGRPGPRNHIPARSTDKAEKYAAGLGVAAKYAGYLDLGNVANDHLTALFNRGLPMPPKVEIETMDPLTPAAYHPGKGSILLNPTAHFWKNPKKIAARMGNEGEWSTNSRLHVFNHETGHLLHHKKSPGMYHNLQGVTLSDTDVDLIRKHVSERATVDPYEFVAEVYAGKVHGVQYPDEIDELYKAFGGPKVD